MPVRAKTSRGGAAPHACGVDELGFELLSRAGLKDAIADLNGANGAIPFVSVHRWCEKAVRRDKSPQTLTAPEAPVIRPRSSSSRPIVSKPSRSPSAYST